MFPLIPKSAGRDKFTQKGEAVLGLAITFETIAFATMFGLGGLVMGAAILALALIIAAVSVWIERRQARLVSARKGWMYYAVNDRFGHRAHARRLVAMDPSRDRWLASGLHAGRLPGSPGNN